MILTGSLIGLGLLSAGNAIYQNHKRNKQVDEANKINRDAAQLSYQAQQETNDLNYKIFQEQQQYNSPANLKAMYDALGLNGDAIVANQGFVPTAAPVMNAPHMDQVQQQAYDKMNPIDAAMTSLMSAFSMKKIQKEIDQIDSDMSLNKAKEDNVIASTQGLLKDVVLKDQQISDNDVQYMMHLAEFDKLNLENAQLIIVNEKLNTELQQNREIHDKVIRMYDDKHALDAAQAGISQYHLDHVAEEFTAMIRESYSRIRKNISDANHIDLLSEAQKIMNFIADNTKHNKIGQIRNESEKANFERDQAYYEWLEAGKKSGWLNPDEDDNDLQWLLKVLTSGYSIGADIFTAPLRGIFSGSVGGLIK